MKIKLFRLLNSPLINPDVTYSGDNNKIKEIVNAMIDLGMQPQIVVVELEKE